jgi:hypothetical protein
MAARLLLAHRLRSFPLPLLGPQVPGSQTRRLAAAHYLWRSTFFSASTAVGLPPRLAA